MEHEDGGINQKTHFKQELVADSAKVQQEIVLEVASQEVISIQEVGTKFQNLLQNHFRMILVMKQVKRIKFVI